MPSSRRIQPRSRILESHLPGSAVKTGFLSWATKRTSSGGNFSVAGSAANVRLAWRKKSDNVTELRAMEFWTVELDANNAKSAVSFVGPSNVERNLFRSSA